MGYLLVNNVVEVYKLEMILMLYSIVIGFSFTLFNKFKAISFQSIAGLSCIIFLSARLLSLKAKFQGHVYNEMFFFIDILVLVSFCRVLSFLGKDYKQEISKEDTEIHYTWLWLAFMMVMTNWRVRPLALAMGSERLACPRFINKNRIKFVKKYMKTVIVLLK